MGQVLRSVQDNGAALVFGLGTDDHPPAIAIAGDLWIPEVPGIALRGVRNQGIILVAKVDAALRARRVYGTHAVLGRNATAIIFQIARIKQPDVGAINHRPTRVAAILVIGQVRVQGIGVVLPRRRRRYAHRRMPPARTLGLAGKRRVVLVEHVQGIAIHKDAIGIIEAALRRGEVKIGTVVHIPDTMET